MQNGFNTNVDTDRTRVKGVMDFSRLAAFPEAPNVRQHL